MITQNETDRLSENFIKLLADKKFNQIKVAGEYANWITINLSIINRWSKASLKNIKIMAWRIIDNG